MRTLSCIFFAALMLMGNACQNEAPASQSTSQDLKALREQLEAKKNELSDKQKIAELEAELKQVDQQIEQVDRSAKPAPQATLTQAPPKAAPAAAVPAGPSGKVVGSNVTIRSGASVQSERLGNFRNGEQVSILESRNVNNENEAILTKPITLNAGESTVFQLPKGKAVVLESYDGDNNTYRVSFQHPENGKLYATVNGDAIQTITYSTWHRVRRSDGQEGWLLGKFLKIN